MTEDTQEEYAVSPLEAEPGESGLTAFELAYLQAAGINPHLLNEMDRDDVIHLLVMHPDRIENPRIGDVAALVYNFGLLREMLEGDIDPDDDDGDDSDDDDDDKNKNRRRRRKDVRQHEQRLFLEQTEELERLPPGEYERRHPVPEAYAKASPPDPRPGLSDIDRMIAGMNAAKLGIVLDMDDGPVAPGKTPTFANEDSTSPSTPAKEPETWVEAITGEAQDDAGRTASVGNAQ